MLRPTHSHSDRFLPLFAIKQIIEDELQLQIKKYQTESKKYWGASLWLRLTSGFSAGDCVRAEEIIRLINATHIVTTQDLIAFIINRQPKQNDIIGLILQSATILACGFTHDHQQLIIDDLLELEANALSVKDKATHKVNRENIVPYLYSQIKAPDFGGELITSLNLRLTAEMKELHSTARPQR